MKRTLVLAAALIAASQAAAAPPRASHIMSLKVCTDGLLMDLAAPQRIASVTYLSREKSALQFWPGAINLPVNHNSPEEVLATHPDLVLTDRYTSPAMKDALAKSGARVVEVPEAHSFADIRAITRLVGDAVGARDRAEQLIADMDQTLATLPKNSNPIRVAGWGGGGYVPGRDTLFNTLLETAGGVNIAEGSGGYYDVETLLAARPDVLAYGDAYIDLPTLRSNQNNHPVLAKLFATRKVTYASAAFACGVPESAAAAAQLHDAMDAAAQTPGGVP
jgi:iron complex transport system substrate-binding protein